MGEQDKEGPSSCFKVVFFILVLLTSATAVTFTVLLGIWGYTGYVGTSPIVISSCSSAYFSQKYSDLDQINKAIFIASCAGSLGAVLSAIVILSWVIRSCSGPGDMSGCGAVFLYLMTGVMGAGFLIPVGYYLSLIIQGRQCTFSSGVGTQVIAIFGLSSCSLVLALIMWSMAICLGKMNASREEKYKQLVSHQTEPREDDVKLKLPEGQKFFSKPRSPAEQRRARIYEQQYTKQNINGNDRRRSPYNRERPYLQPDNVRENDYRARFVPKSKEENPIFNLHPSLSIGEEFKTKPYQNEDDTRYLREEQSRYYSTYDQGRPIISNGRREERERDDRREDRREDRYRRGRSRERYQDNDRDNYRSRGRNNRGRNERGYNDYNRNRRGDYRGERNDYIRERESPGRQVFDPSLSRQKEMYRVLTRQ